MHVAVSRIAVNRRRAVEDILGKGDPMRYRTTSIVRAAYLEVNGVEHVVVHPCANQPNKAEWEFDLTPETKRLLAAFDDNETTMRIQRFITAQKCLLTAGHKALKENCEVWNNGSEQ